MDLLVLVEAQERQVLQVQVVRAVQVDHLALQVLVQYLVQQIM